VWRAHAVADRPSLVPDVSDVSGAAAEGGTLPERAPDDFFAIDIRVGTVLRAEPFPEARKPSIKLLIDFGPELGTRRSSAQITTHYAPDALVGRQVVAVTNIGTRRVAGFVSEVLVLGAMPTATEVILLAPDHRVANGTKIG
jgi:tRNA-binding protein